MVETMVFQMVQTTKDRLLGKNIIQFLINKFFKLFFLRFNMITPLENIKHFNQNTAAANGTTPSF